MTCSTPYDDFSDLEFLESLKTVADMIVQVPDPDFENPSRSVECYGVLKEGSIIYASFDESCFDSMYKCDSTDWNVVANEIAVFAAEVETFLVRLEVAE